MYGATQFPAVFTLHDTSVAIPQSTLDVSPFLFAGDDLMHVSDPNTQASVWASAPDISWRISGLYVSSSVLK